MSSHDVVEVAVSVLELVVDGQRISLFHIRAIAAFRQQWHADSPRELLAHDAVARCSRECQLDQLFVRLVNDAGAESMDVLHEESGADDEGGEGVGRGCASRRSGPAADAGAARGRVSPCGFGPSRDGGFLREKSKGREVCLFQAGGAWCLTMKARAVGLLCVLLGGCMAQESDRDIARTSEPIVGEDTSDICRSELSRDLLKAFDYDKHFAGFFLGEDGRYATVLFTDGASLKALEESARRLLRPVEQTVYSIDGSVKTVSMADAELRFKEAQFSLERLVAVEEALCRQVVKAESAAEVRMDYLANRLIVAGDVNVPEADSDVVLRKAYRAYEPTATVRDHRRPVVAGTQTLHAGVNSSTETCTLGFVAKFGTTLRYITASHCSPQLFSVPGVFPPEYRQNGWTAFDGVGTEVQDPGPNCGTKCRRTDATVASVAFPAQTTFGAVAVPTQLNSLVNAACQTGTCTQINVGNYGIPLQFGFAILPGQNVERIGRTSGRVFGTFQSYNTTPISLPSARHGTYSVGRHGFVTVSSGVSWTTGSNIAVPGDSGGPVLRSISGVAFIPEGIVFSSRFGVTPSDPPDFQFSTLNDLVSDLGSFTVF